jgi:hypothetical protein
MTLEDFKKDPMKVIERVAKRKTEWVEEMKALKEVYKRNREKQRAKYNYKQKFK